MTWTYTRPSASDRDMVRYRVQDTDTNDQLITDEEIDDDLLETGSVNGAIVAVCKTLLARFARAVDQRGARVSVNRGQLFTHWKELLSELETTYLSTLASPYAGGISVADKAIDEADEDIVRSGFYREMGDA